MKLEELDYQFENAGQYRAIMKSLGYREEYSNGYIKFSSDEGTIQRSINDIKAAAKELNITEDSYNASLAYITSFFDKEKAKADFNSYNKYLEDNYNISIAKWDNLKENQRLNENQSIDGFTIIDHKNKISYTGSRLYKYGYENGFVLDGKGPQVDNDLTEILNLTGGKGKLKKNKAGNLTIESNHILIPYQLFGKFLEDWQRTGLEHGEIVLVRNSKNKPIYLQVDQKNNIIVVRTDKEIKLPKSVGGHEFSDLEKTLILNNKFTSPILIKDDNKYWLAETRLSEDKKGFEFKNMIEVSKDKAKEIQDMDIRNSKETAIYSNGKAIEPDKHKELEIALLKGLHDNTHDGALSILLENARNGISTNMPNLYEKYGLTDLKNDLEEKRSIILRNETPEATKEFNDALEKFKDKLKENLLVLEPGIYPDKRELAQDIKTVNEILIDMDKNPNLYLDSELENVIQQEKELSRILSKYGNSQDIENFGNSFLHIDTETLIHLGIADKLNNLPYVKDNPLNIEKIESPLYATLGNIEVEKICQNIKDLKFYYSENRLDPTINKEDSFYTDIFDQIKAEDQKLTVLNNSLLEASFIDKNQNLSVTEVKDKSLDLPLGWEDDLSKFQDIKKMEPDEFSQLIYKYKSHPSITESQIRFTLENKLEGEYLNYSNSISAFLDTDYSKQNNISPTEIDIPNAKPIHLLICKSQLSEIEESLRANINVLNEIKSERKEITGYHNEYGGLGRDQKDIDLEKYEKETISLNEEFEKIEKIEKALDQKFNISEINVTNEIELNNDITPEEKQTIQPKDESVYLTVQEQKVIAAIAANDYVELNKIAQSNFTPSEALKKEIEGLNLSQDKKVGVMAILGYDSLDKPKTTIEKDKEKKGPTKTNAKDQTLKAIDGLFR
jgi:hypothetical protein